MRDLALSVSVLNAPFTNICVAERNNKQKSKGNKKDEINYIQDVKIFIREID